VSKLKRWFITPYLLGITAAVVVSAAQLAAGRWAWAAVLLLTVPTAVVTVVHTLVPRNPRTSRRYPSFVAAGALGLAGSFLGWPDAVLPITAAVLFAGLLLYLYWYSEFHLPKSRFLTVGQNLPRFEAFDLTGMPVDSSSLAGSPALILFYRGNWCPVCTAQIHELAREYGELSRRGIRVVLVSPQPDNQSADLASRVALPFEFWEDRGNAAARALNIVDPAGLPLGMEALGYGSDTPLPTAILVDAQGTILYSDQAENYRVRPEPRAYLEAFDRSEVAPEPRQEL